MMQVIVSYYIVLIERLNVRTNLRCRPTLSINILNPVRHTRVWYLLDSLLIFPRELDIISLRSITDNKNLWIEHIACGYATKNTRLPRCICSLKRFK